MPEAGGGKDARQWDTRVERIGVEIGMDVRGVELDC